MTIRTGTAVFLACLLWAAPSTADERWELPALEGAGSGVGGAAGPMQMTLYFIGAGAAGLVGPIGLIPLLGATGIEDGGAVLAMAVLVTIPVMAAVNYGLARLLRVRVSWASAFLAATGGVTAAFLVGVLGWSTVTPSSDISGLGEMLIVLFFASVAHAITTPVLVLLDPASLAVGGSGGDLPYEATSALPRQAPRAASVWPVFRAAF